MMDNDPAPAQVLLFGEVLWDRLPQGDFLGGAPLNVAWNLHGLGVSAYIMSSVGEDAAGQEARRRLREAGLPLDLLQTTVEGLPTGEALVTLDAAGVPEFSLPEPAAYDDIQPSPEAAAALSEARFLYYGTLATRAVNSRRTLHWLWDMAPELARFCDLNLRAPHYDRQAIAHALNHADILKINESELCEIAAQGLLPGNAAAPQNDLPQALRNLGQAHGLDTIYLTRGPEPLLVWDAVHCPQTAEFAVPPPRKPAPDADTVGAGDAFCAGVLQALVDARDWQDVIGQGLRTAAAVCGIAGAQPSGTAFYQGL